MPTIVRTSRSRKSLDTAPAFLPNQGSGLCCGPRYPYLYETGSILPYAPDRRQITGCAGCTCGAGAPANDPPTPQKATAWQAGRNAEDMKIGPVRQVRCAFHLSVPRPRGFFLVVIRFADDLPFAADFLEVYRVGDIFENDIHHRQIAVDLFAPDL